ncbi:adomet-dependent trna methyltransferase complex subunit [Paraphaeosphaeria sporulosa]
MKLITLNFVTCALKSCKSSPASFPLHPRDATLEVIETDLNLAFLKNILPRLEWNELCVITAEVRYNPSLVPNTPREAVVEDSSPPTREDLVVKPEGEVAEGAEAEEEASQTAKDLHRVLLETTVKEGKLVCGNCGHEYKVMEGVPNFLLPGHLV